jgi:hypothetical protein
VLGLDRRPRNLLLCRNILRRRAGNFAFILADGLIADNPMEGEVGDAPLDQGTLPLQRFHTSTTSAVTRVRLEHDRRA